MRVGVKWVGGGGGGGGRGENQLFYRLTENISDMFKTLYASVFVGGQWVIGFAAHMIAQQYLFGHTPITENG